MEDAIFVQSPLPESLLSIAAGSNAAASSLHSQGSGVYAVFDGHGGAFCSTWV
jgi:serine/threonine protein phosphatase PrpC